MNAVAAAPAHLRPPHRLARATGALLFVMAAAAIFAEVGVRSALVVPGDPAATAAKVLAAPGRFRLGFFGYVVAFLCDVPVAVLLHRLFRRASPALSQVTMALRLVYTAIAAAALLPYAGAILLLGGEGYLGALPASQLHALALLCMDAFQHGFSLALVFFGVHLLGLGWLLVASRQLPRALGVLVGLGGVAYVVDGATAYLAPELRAAIFPALALLGMAELVLAAWMVVKGLRAPA